MKIRVFLINFPEKLDVDVSVYKRYKLEYADKIEDYMLCLAQSILAYGFLDEEKNKNYNFYKPIDFIDEVQYLTLCSSPFETLKKIVGTEREVNPRQFEIIKGSIVRSKIDPRLGPGVVKKVGSDKILVDFPNADKIYDNAEFNCHPSTLRVVTHIREVQKNVR